MAKFLAESVPVCCSCKKRLTLVEWHYYKTRCNECEQTFAERIYNWRHGAKDEELDRIYQPGAMT